MARKAGARCAYYGASRQCGALAQGTGAGTHSKTSAGYARKSAAFAEGYRVSVRFETINKNYVNFAQIGAQYFVLNL